MYGPARVINRSCSDEGRLTAFHSYHGNLCETVAIFFPLISAPYLNSSNERQRTSQKYLTFSQTSTDGWHVLPKDDVKPRMLQNTKS
jgi:hypothetical protein